jgi:MYXO-CTERM domain-containing protein
VSVVHRDKSGTDRGGYCGYTDGFLICGQSSEGYKKWDVRDEAAIKLAGHGTDPEAAGGDFDFATALGNLVYLGNDHGSGAALIPHQTGADTTAPKVVKIYPLDGDVKQPLGSRITVFFSDDIDLDTVLAKNIVVRKNGDCTPLTGVFSKSSFNAISFGTKAPLVADATYDVVVPAGGVKDLAGNVITAGAVAHFSTGAAIESVMACAGDGEVVGPGNEGGSSSGGAAGSGGTVSMAGTATGGMPMTAGSNTGGVTSVSAGSDTGGSVSSAGSGAGTAPMGAAASEPGGCGCSVPGRSPLGAASLLLAGLAWLGVRRGRTRRQRNRAGRA